MIIWGGRHMAGQIPGEDLRCGARYNPKTDEWTALPDNPPLSSRAGHAAVWTGREMIVWGGGEGQRFLNDGASFNPATGRWTALSAEGVGRARALATAVWTGQAALFFGGSVGTFEAFNDLSVYQPVAPQVTAPKAEQD
jgi:N-acetylneuraminic acid mutarotase